MHRWYLMPPRAGGMVEERSAFGAYQCRLLGLSPFAGCLSLGKLGNLSDAVPSVSDNNSSRGGEDGIR